MFLNWTVDGIEAEIKWAGKHGKGIQQRSLAGIEPWMLQLNGMTYNYMGLQTGP